jgi:NADH-quinone oxidoreductase subunit L
MGAALWLTILLPAVVAAALLASGPKADRIAGPAAIATALVTLLISAAVWAFRPASAMPWLPYGEETLSLTLSAARSAGPLSVVVAGVTLLVLIYALGFLDLREQRARFFGFMALFLAAMQLFVFAQDLLVVLISWEIMGACSYALIGFWHHELERVHAANRAFLVTRTTDLGMWIAVLAAVAAGGLDIAGLAHADPAWQSLITLGLIVAACGKSAQLPFSGWLSGAMQGPTPVSALLHSTTMVAAGAILLVKISGLLEVTGLASLVLWIGIATALVGGLLALYEDELKQVLAASTISQYGYMFAAIGAAGAAASTTHLVSHAAFKALLFLGAGLLVRHGLHLFQEMGGVRRRVPQVAALFLIGALSLAALPPFGSFVTSDMLLTRVKEAGLLAFGLLLLAKLVTAAYALRAYLAVFEGPVRYYKADAVPRPRNGLVWPMGVLAVATLVPLALVLEPVRGWWSATLALDPLPSIHLLDAAMSLTAVAAGLLLAWILHRRFMLAPMEPLIPIGDAQAALRWGGLIRGLDLVGKGALALARRVDRIERKDPATRVGHAALRLARRVASADERDPADRVGQSTLAWARSVAVFDAGPLDVATAGMGARAGLRFARFSAVADRGLWDALIAALARSLDGLGATLGRIQSGLLHRYYVAATVGMALLFLYALAVSALTLSGSR